MKDEMNKNIPNEKSPEKKRRGRPRLLPPELEKMHRNSGRHYVDIRTIQNDDYKCRAVNVLGLGRGNPPDFPYRWLGDPSKIKLGFSDRQSLRSTILTELGRIEDANLMRSAAKRICELKPKTNEAIGMLRRARLLRNPKPKKSLENLIQEVINSYLANNPETKNAEVHNALLDVALNYLDFFGQAKFK